MEKKYYLAYGSNLNLLQMHWRCPDAVPIGKGFIKGYELLFKGGYASSYLTIEKKDGGNVPVGVWAISEDDEERLDRYEGFPRSYYKKDMRLEFEEMETGRKRTEDCFVYIMHERCKLGAPSSKYMLTCIEGYKGFGFDNKPLYAAYERSKGWV